MSTEVAIQLPGDIGGGPRSAVADLTKLSRWISLGPTSKRTNFVRFREYTPSFQCSLNDLIIRWTKGRNSLQNRQREIRHGHRRWLVHQGSSCLGAWKFYHWQPTGMKWIIDLLKLFSDPFTYKWKFVKDDSTYLIVHVGHGTYLAPAGVLTNCQRLIATPIPFHWRLKRLQDGNYRYVTDPQVQGIKTQGFLYIGSIRRVRFGRKRSPWSRKGDPWKCHSAVGRLQWPTESRMEAWTWYCGVSEISTGR